MDFPSNDSYFSLLNLSFVENCHISIFTTFAKQSMINRLSNSINRNRSAAKISKVMSSSCQARADVRRPVKVRGWWCAVESAPDEWRRSTLFFSSRAILKFNTWYFCG